MFNVCKFCKICKILPDFKTAYLPERSLPIQTETSKKFAKNLATVHFLLRSAGFVQVANEIVNGPGVVPARAGAHYAQQLSNYYICYMYNSRSTQLSDGDRPQAYARSHQLKKLTN